MNQKDKICFPLPFICVLNPKTIKIKPKTNNLKILSLFSLKPKMKMEALTSLNKVMILLLLKLNKISANMSQLITLYFPKQNSRHTKN